MQNINFWRVAGTLLAILALGFIFMKIAAVNLNFLWLVFIVIIVGAGVRLVFLLKNRQD